MTLYNWRIPGNSATVFSGTIKEAETFAQTEAALLPRWQFFTMFTDISSDLYVMVQSGNMYNEISRNTRLFSHSFRSSVPTRSEMEWIWRRVYSHDARFEARKNLLLRLRESNPEAAEKAMARMGMV